MEIAKRKAAMSKRKVSLDEARRIGAGSKVDGQVLVIHDMLGINKEFKPRFLRRYSNLYDEMKSAVEKYVADVKKKDFPNEREQY